MKKLLLPTLALLAVSMFSCTEREYENVESNELVTIKLNAGLTQTKAAIVSDNEGTLSSELIGVQFIRLDGEAASLDWTTATAATFTGTIGTDKNITGFTQYYPTDGTNVNIMGYYPAATSIANGKLSMTIDGNKDVIYAAPVTGNKTTEVSAMQFDHKLTQFKFIVKKDATITEEVSGVTVTIKDANTTFDMDIANGQLSNFGTPISTIKTIDNKTTSTTPSEGFMLQPELGQLSLHIKADGFEEKDINIQPKDPETKFAAGTAYTITIVLSKKNIVASAAITQWTNGTNPDDYNFQ